MKAFTITAVGDDRPGIVAGFTQVLLDLGCNLADCSMSRLADQFAMILLIEAPDALAPSRLESALAEPMSRFGLVATMKELTGGARPEAAEPYVVSAYGKDRPGIVHAVAAALAQQGINIVDLRSHLAGEDLYALILDIAVPPAVNMAGLEASLEGVAAGLGVSLTLRSAEAAEL